MTKFLVLKDSKGVEFVLNPASIRMFTLEMSHATDLNRWCNVFFIGSEDSVLLDVDYEILKELLVNSQ